MPLTVNVVFFLPDDGERCARRARALARPDDVAPVVRAGLTLKSVEVNLQTSRWPSTIRPDLGGHADYLLRVFHAGPGGSLVAAPLENMPDVDRIQRDPALRRALAAWLRAPGVLAKIDDGTALLPERPAGDARGQRHAARARARRRTRRSGGCCPRRSSPIFRSPGRRHVRRPRRCCAGWTR